MLHGSSSASVLPARSSEEMFGAACFSAVRQSVIAEGTGRTGGLGAGRRRSDSNKTTACDL